MSDDVLALEPRERFDPAIIGIARRFAQEFLVYDEAKVLAVFEADAREAGEDDPEGSAREYYEYNTVGAWVGDGTPAFVRPWDES